MFKILLLLFARTTILIGGRLGHSAIFFTGGMPLKEIKTKPEGGKPKLLDKAAKAPKTAMKDLWLKSKDKSISPASAGNPLTPLPILPGIRCCPGWKPPPRKART